MTWKLYWDAKSSIESSVRAIITTLKVYVRLINLWKSKHVTWTLSLARKIRFMRFGSEVTLVPFNWIRFLEMNKLCHVIAKNLTFSTNQKLISISWKVWTCSNFSTNWKWKWMNRIRHGRKNVVGKQIWVNLRNNVSL